MGFNRTGIAFATAALLAATSLAACDNGPSAVTSQGSAAAQADARGGGPPSGADAASSFDPRDQGRAQGDGGDRRTEPAALIDGKPEWAASRRYSARENADRAFARNGADFQARDRQDFIRKAHAFVERPPKGALTMTRRNGDKLIYDPAGNVFAVTTRDGALRTMFKPDDGMSYWEAQKSQAEARRGRDREGARDTGA